MPKNTTTASDMPPVVVTSHPTNTIHDPIWKVHAFARGPEAAIEEAMTQIVKDVTVWSVMPASMIGDTDHGFYRYAITLNPLVVLPNSTPETVRYIVDYVEWELSHLVQAYQDGEHTEKDERPRNPFENDVPPESTLAFSQPLMGPFGDWSVIAFARIAQPDAWSSGGHRKRGAPAEVLAFEKFVEGLPEVVLTWGAFWKYGIVQLEMLLDPFVFRPRYSRALIASFLNSLADKIQTFSP